MKDARSYLYVGGSKVYSLVDKEKFGASSQVIVPALYRPFLDIMQDSKQQALRPRQRVQKYVYHIAKAPSEYNVEVKPERPGVSRKPLGRSDQSRDHVSSRKDLHHEEDGNEETIRVIAWMPAVEIPLRLRKRDFEMVCRCQC